MINRIRGKILDRWKVLIEHRKRRENSQERSSWCCLNNKPLTFPSNNRILSGQLKLARNLQGLIPSVLEEFDIPLGHPF
jgi:hypothetical protein